MVWLQVVDRVSEFVPPPRSQPAEKECLGTCVQNMQQSDDLSPLEIVEMFAGLSCFLKDSSDVSQTLLDDFRMCQGYAFLCDLMLRYRLPRDAAAAAASASNCWRSPIFGGSVLHPGASVSRLEQTKEDESKDALKDLVNLVTCLTTYGVTELKPAGLTTGAPFLLPGFVLPQPSAKGLFTSKASCFSAAVLKLMIHSFFPPSNQSVSPKFILRFPFFSQQENEFATFHIL